MDSKLNAFVTADPAKCIGCRVCEVACSAAHSDQPGATVGTMTAPVIPRLYLVRTPEVTVPVQCRHCEDAPCANACPVAAITQIQHAILIDADTCIGCKTCMLACPFGAIDLVPVYKDGEPVSQSALKVESQAGLRDKEWIVANKCDLCHDRAGGPACVEACPEKALTVMYPQKDQKRRNREAAFNLLHSMKNFMGG